jgi:hypothetical protein
VEGIVPSLREKKAFQFLPLYKAAPKNVQLREKIGFFPYSFPFFSLISRLLVSIQLLYKAAPKNVP